MLSDELGAWKLKKLVGREGKIVSELQNEKNKGYWVELDISFGNEKEWFVPVSSIQLLS